MRKFLMVAVTCVAALGAVASAGYCLAVGEAIPGNGTVTSFADRWTGKAWKLVPAP